MKLTNWYNREYDITIENGEPSKYLDDLLAPLTFRKRWQHKEIKVISRDEIPHKFERDKYDLIYNIKRSANEDKEEFDFIMYLVDKAVDYINNLETILISSEEEKQPNDKEDIF